MSRTGDSRDKIYYTAERGYYVQPPEGGSTVVVEKETPVWTPCLCVLVGIFALFIIALLIVLIIFFTLGVQAVKVGESSSAGLASNDNAPLMSTSAVYDRIHKKDAKKPCLLDTAFFGSSPAQDYIGEHLPNAVHFDINAVTRNTTTTRHEPVTPTEFQEYVRKLGIDSDCHVIAYDHADAKNAIISATYVWWLFQLFGHSKVSVMNGGLVKWRKDGLPVQKGTTASDTRPAGNFQSSQLNSKLIITFDELVQQVTNNRSQLIDVRTAEEFAGTAPVKPPAKYAGHIKGAVNYPIENVIGNDGVIKSAKEVRTDLLARKVNLDGSRPNTDSTAVYCETGMRASALYLVLTQLAVPSAKLYNGGWLEWSQKAPQGLSVTP